jgi:hypothetical protein
MSDEHQTIRGYPNQFVKDFDEAVEWCKMNGKPLSMKNVVGRMHGRWNGGVSPLFHQDAFWCGWTEMLSDSGSHGSPNKLYAAVAEVNAVRKSISKKLCHRYSTSGVKPFLTMFSRSCFNSNNAVGHHPRADCI